jgi:hypothetical protein
VLLDDKGKEEADQPVAVPKSGAQERRKRSRRQSHVSEESGSGKDEDWAGQDDGDDDQAHDDDADDGSAGEFVSPVPERTSSQLLGLVDSSRSVRRRRESMEAMVGSSVSGRSVSAQIAALAAKVGRVSCLLHSV